MYYSPELCRFISPDDVEYLDPESVNGLNLYSYCMNDPINKYDPSGHSAILAILIAVGIFAVDTIVETSILMCSDDYKAEKVYKLDPKTGKENVNIPNSALFNNPIAQTIYANYLYKNVKRADGSNYFNGSVNDIIGEWQAHNDASKLGFASSHGDINHWFPKLLGKDMNDVRADVASKLNGGSSSNYSEEWVSGYWYEKDGSQTYEYKGEWKKNDKGWWFEDSSGWYPTSKWQKIDGKWYYFKESGYMAADEWIDGWYCGKDGAYDSSVKKSTTSQKEVQVTAAALNVRKGATAASPVVAVVKKGEVFTITSEQNGFGKLSSGIGWIMLKYTKTI